MNPLLLIRVVSPLAPSVISRIVGGAPFCTGLRPQRFRFGFNGSQWCFALGASNGDEVGVVHYTPEGALREAMVDWASTYGGPVYAVAVDAYARRCLQN